MVDEESYGLNETAALKRKACVVAVRRSKNGQWRVKVDFEIELRLPDGRLVTAWEVVEIKARGEKKKHPDPFGWKKRAAIAAATGDKG